MSAWKNAMIKARKEAARPPAGAVTLDQLCEEMGLSRDHARKEANRLIRLGRAEMIPGKIVSETGSIANTNYYRLLPVVPVKAAAKKRS